MLIVASFREQNGECSVWSVEKRGEGQRKNYEFVYPCSSHSLLTLWKYIAPRARSSYELGLHVSYGKQHP